MTRAFLLLVAWAGAIPLACLPRPTWAAPPGTGWRLVFADEFSGSSLDSMKWSPNYYWGRTHNHRAYMHEDQILLSAGTLTLQAVAQRHPNAPATTSHDGQTFSLDYTSGAIHSATKFRMTHGYVEARMRMADVTGTWPAFWMLKDGWPPEIDIMEFPRGAANSTSQYWANYHYGPNAANAKSYGWQISGPDLTAGFNVFGMEWDGSAMRFYLNGTLRHSTTDTAAIAQAQDMYLILNQAVGGWPGNPTSNAAFPSNFEIDWVRAWQKPGSGGGTTAWNVAGNGSWDSGSAWTAGVPKFSEQTVRFGRVGSAAASTVNFSNSRTVGGIEFSGAAGGTTAYTIGSASGSLQVANTAGAVIEALSSSTADQRIDARVELYHDTTVRNAMTGSRRLTLGGGVTGGGKLTVAGTGIVRLTGTGAWTGGTEITAGTLEVGGGGTAGSLGPGGVANAGTLVFDRSDTTSVSNVISGAGTVRKQGTGQLSLTGANTFTGPLEINAGVLAVGVSGNPFGTAAGGTTVSAGAMIQLNGTRTIAEPLTIAGTGTAAANGALRIGGGASPTWSGPITLAADAHVKLDGGTSLTLSGGIGGAGRSLTLKNDSGASGTVSGAIATGAGSLTVIGAGTSGGDWTLTAANTFTGGTTVAAGTLRLAGGNNRLSTAGSVTLGSAAAAGRLVLGSSSTPSSQTLTGLTAIGNGGRVVGGNAAASTLTLAIAAGTNEFSGRLGGPGTNENNLGLVKTGSGTLVLSGNNSFGGGTFTLGGSTTDVGAIRLAHASALGGHTEVALASSQGGISRLELAGGVALSLPLTTRGRLNATAAGAVLTNIAGENAWNGPITIIDSGGGYGFVADAGTLTLGGQITSTVNSTLGRRTVSFAGDGSFVVSGNIVRGGSLASQDLLVTKTGTGSLALTGTNDYTGLTTVSAGTLAIGSGGTTGSIVGDVANDALVVFDRSNDWTYGGTITGSGEVRKHGAGVLTLSAASSHAGGTTITAGTLRLTGGPDRLPAAGPLAFTGSGRLDLTGTSQSLAGLSLPDRGQHAVFVVGTGGLAVTGGALETGPGGTGVTAADATTLDLSGLQSFSFESAGDFRVGLRTGATNTGPLAEVATVRLAASSTIAAGRLAVGDRAGSNDGGISTLVLGSETTIRTDSINLGGSGRSDVAVHFAPGDSPLASFRGSDGTGPVGDWIVGNVAQFNGAAQTTFTAAVDLSAGTTDALVSSLRIGTAEIGGGTNRAGTQISNLTLGAGTLTVDMLRIGLMSSTAAATVGGPLAAHGTFTLADPAGTVVAETILLAENDYRGGGASARTVSGTLALEAGTLRAATIARGPQAGTVTSATAALAWTGGTIGTKAGGDLTIDTVPITLASGTHTFDATGSGAITVNASSPISGPGGLAKTGSGRLVLSGTNTYTGPTAVSAGTLLINGNHSTASGSLTVALAATLGGTGTVGGPTTVSGTHAPGASPGLQTFSAGLAYDSTSTLVWELSANTELSADRGTLYDGIDVTGGSLDIAAGSVINLVFNAPLVNATPSAVNWADSFWDTDRSWTAISFSSGSPATSTGLFTLGTVGLDSLGQSLTSVTGREAASFTVLRSGDDIVVQYSAVPEPGALALGGLGLAAAAWAFRRRARRHR